MDNCEPLLLDNRIGRLQPTPHEIAFFLNTFYGAREVCRVEGGLTFEIENDVASNTVDVSSAKYSTNDIMKEKDHNINIFHQNMEINIGHNKSY